MITWWKSAIGSASYSRSIHRTSSMNVNVPAVDGVISSWMRWWVVGSGWWVWVVVVVVVVVVVSSHGHCHITRLSLSG